MYNGANASYQPKEITEIHNAFDSAMFRDLIHQTKGLYTRPTNQSVDCNTRPPANCHADADTPWLITTFNLASVDTHCFARMSFSLNTAMRISISARRFLS